MDWLEGLGFPIVERRWARTAEEAAEAVRELGRPVAMKVVNPAIAHKTDAGGVLLDVANAENAIAAFHRLRGIAAGDGFQGVLVAPMIPDAVEVLVGLSRDPQFGPVVACGLGGIHTEALNDLALRVAPIDPDEALAMIDELRGTAILHGTRGQARAIDTLAELLARVSMLPFLSPEIEELDLNPVFLLERGCAIADVHLTRGEHSIHDAEEAHT
jgi:succinyl-CoA synthetase beta subunit